MKHSLLDHSGYLIIDHSSSPGIKESEVPEKLRKTTIVCQEGQIVEKDIQQCSHCQRMIVLEGRRTRPRGYCSYCHHYICDSCDLLFRKSGQCVPFQLVMDKEEKKIILTDKE